MNIRHPMFVPVVGILWLGFGLVGSYLLAPDKFQTYWNNIPEVLAALLFWGLPCAFITIVLTGLFLRLVGIKTLRELGDEIITQNNAAAAIILVGAPLIALVFLQWVIRP